MSDWRPISAEKLNQPRSSTIRDVDVTVYFGADDMPEAVRARTDSTRRRLIVEFRYDRESETRRYRDYSDEIRIVVGRKSGRLYQVEFDMQKLGWQQVETLRVLGEVRNTLKSLPDRAGALGINRIDNYIAASGAFDQVEPQLEHDLTAAD